MSIENPNISAPPPLPFDDGEDEDGGERGLTTDEYTDRTGYTSSFLGRGHIVPLPRPTATLRPHVLKFETVNGQDNLLRYTHFSVMMHRPRRMCIFSAVNIDGLVEKADVDSRPSWRYDPRIPRDFQIKGECYGRETDGKFSRGHMTRREDPNWGELALAEAANRDTFHVTNACPQWQPFNAGVWLGLEDYALHNARERDIRISVFTGPVLKEDDPLFFGVAVPLAFWKIIAFIHNKTNKLSATGYLLQAELPEVRDLEGDPFGPYKTYQRSIEEIEELTHLSFGRITALDPLFGTRNIDPQPLGDFDEIQLV
jgi:endonuclease G, mitochondrial